MPAPDIIQQLVERFEEHKDMYRSRKYNETQLRRMLELHKQSPRTPQESAMVKREIESTDGKIDRLVYELYGLTEDEIKIVDMYNAV